MIDQCFFTVATGDKYLSFAFTLARSYKFHHDDEIPFFIISDTDFTLPKDLRWIKKKIITGDLLTSGVSYKFNFDQITPAYKSIFIDADSIIYGNISHVFNIPNSAIQIIGMKETKGNWAGLELPEVLDHFAIPYIIRYCGAFYYIIKNQLTANICETAKQLSLSNYMFQRHTKSVNDEPVLSISLAKSGTTPYADTGNIWTDTVQFKTHNQLNTLYNKALFNNSKDYRYKYWLPEGEYRPLIIHFGGNIYNKNPWIFDALRLKLFYHYHLPKKVANLAVEVIFKPIYFFGKALKQLLK